jgi:thymidylate synthase (FAD)
MSDPVVRVIGYTAFVGVPPEYAASEDQDQGSPAARLIETAGRTCYASYGKGRSSAAFHQHLLEVGHGNPLEHASLSFHISRISRACANEWVRHRAGCAISQRSSRYCDESQSEWCWHPILSKTGGADLDLPLGAVQAEARRAYRAVYEAVFRALSEEDVDLASAKKQARGAARGILGNALSTELVFSCNIRALRHILEQRASPFADAEIRLLANRVYEAALPCCPEYLGDYTRTPAPDGIGFCLETEHRKV